MEAIILNESLLRVIKKILINNSSQLSDSEK